MNNDSTKGTNLKELDFQSKDRLSDSQYADLQEKVKLLDPAAEAPIRLLHKLMLIPDEQKSHSKWFTPVWAGSLAFACLAVIIISTKQAPKTFNQPVQIAISSQQTQNKLSYLTEDVIFEIDLFEPDVAILGTI